MKLNKPYTDEQYADLAVYCNENNCHIEDKGEYLEAVDNPLRIPTEEEQRQARANTYQAEIDPITAHIWRLRDQDPAPEGKIAELIAERDAKVEEIRARYPYPKEVENDTL